MNTTPKQVTIGILMPLGSQVGGAEALFGHLLRHKSRRYRYICGFLQDGPLVREAQDLGYEATVFHATRLSEVRNYARTIQRLRTWVKRNNIDVVVSWMSKGHLYMGVAAAGLRVKRLWFQHSVPSGSAYIDRLITLLPAHGVLCCSQTSKECQDKLFPKRRNYVCYPGVVLRSVEASQTEARAHLGLPSTAPVIGMVARLERWKGAHVFIDAAQRVVEKDPTVTFFVVGGAHSLDLPYAQEIEAMVKRLDFGDRFILAGQRTMEEALLWQAAADIIVHPVTGIEPFGMAVVEAMAQGKVVVTSNRGGPAEVIHNGANGILIGSGDPQALASTLNRLLEQPEERRLIGEQASIRGRTFSIAAFVSRFEALVQDVLARP